MEKTESARKPQKKTSFSLNLATAVSSGGQNNSSNPPTPNSASSHPTPSPKTLPNVHLLSPTSSMDFKLKSDDMLSPKRRRSMDRNKARAISSGSAGRTTSAINASKSDSFAVNSGSGLNSGHTSHDDASHSVSNSGANSLTCSPLPSPVGSRRESLDASSTGPIAAVGGVMGSASRDATPRGADIAVAEGEQEWPPLSPRVRVIDSDAAPNDTNFNNSSSSVEYASSSGGLVRTASPRLDVTTSQSGGLKVSPRNSARRRQTKEQIDLLQASPRNRPSTETASLWSVFSSDANQSQPAHRTDSSGSAESSAGSDQDSILPRRRSSTSAAHKSRPILASSNGNANATTTKSDPATDANNSGSANSSSECAQQNSSSDTSTSSSSSTATAVNRTQSAIVAPSLTLPSLSANERDSLRRRKSTGDTSHKVAKNKDSNGNSKSRLHANNSSGGVSPRSVKRKSDNNPVAVSSSDPNLSRSATNNSSSNNLIAVSSSDPNLSLDAITYNNAKPVSFEQIQQQQQRARTENVTVGVDNVMLSSSSGQPATTTIVANVMINIAPLEQNASERRNVELRTSDPIIACSAETSLRRSNEILSAADASASVLLSEALREKEDWQRRYAQLEEERQAEKILFEMQQQQQIERGREELHRLDEEIARKKAESERELQREREKRELELRVENELREKEELRRANEEKTRFEVESEKTREALLRQQRRQASEAEAKVAELLLENARLEKAALEAEQKKRDAELKSREAEAHVHAIAQQLERAALDVERNFQLLAEEKNSSATQKPEQQRNHNTYGAIGNSLASNNASVFVMPPTPTVSASSISPSSSSDALLFKKEANGTPSEFNTVVFSPPSNVRIDERKLFALRPDITFDIILLGESSVGKSHYLHYLMTREVDFALHSTIGCEVHQKRTIVEQKILEVQVWDTAGQERFRAMTNNFFNGKLGAILFFSIEDRKSFESVPYWVQQLRRINAEAKILLVGSKNDVALRAVSSEEGAALVAQGNLFVGYMECSAKTGDRCDDVFDALISSIVAGFPRSPSGALEAPMQKSRRRTENEKAAANNLDIAGKEKKGEEDSSGCC